MKRVGEDLAGTTTLITGAGAGLGRALTERFVECGGHVVAFDRNGESLERLAADLGPAVATVCGDVRRVDDHARAVTTALDRFGRIDCLIANAGIWDYLVRLADLEAEQIDAAFDEIFAVNVKGYLLAARACLPSLVRSRGAVIFTLSNAAYYANGGGALYTATKHAIVGLVRQLAWEFAPTVRVNGVAPAAIASDLRGPAALGMAQRSIGEFPLATLVPPLYPLGRMPETGDYTSAYMLLASRSASASTTGSVFVCDGGIGVRGFESVAGGAGLAERYGSIE